uniref:pregnancy-specific glycoprotein 22-like isoform X2 n=1 Tax=Centroberyx gerrardi TaxID=166262 RepID=UPI003AAAA58F
MEAVIGLLMMLPGVSHGVETYCDGRQNGAQCFGALGGTVVLQLITQDSEIYAYQWLKNESLRVLYVRNNKVLVNELKNRSSFTPSNGTFRISNISWTDNAEYSLRIFDLNGKLIATRKLQLSIQGVETYCDGRQNGAQCFGALGGTVVLQLITQDSEIYTYRWSKNEMFTVLYVRNNKVLVNELKNRSSFTPSNGTFRISNISWTDNAEYSLHIFDLNGQEIATRKLQLSIQGVETYCDGRQNGAQCFGALGGTVVLRLITQASEMCAYKWIKNKNFTVFMVKNNKVVVNELKSRSSFTPSNGTFRISNISWTDNAEYSLRIFNQHGQRIATRKLQLSIQAPVSSPLLASECLSQEEMRVSCSCEGDSPQYSWTLNGHAPMDAELVSGDNETNSITLKPGLSGQLVCSVKNHISSATASKNISACEEHIPAIARLLSATVFLLVSVVGICCVRMKMKNSTAQESENAQDATYANVRIEYRGGDRIIYTGGPEGGQV